MDLIISFINGLIYGSVGALVCLLLIRFQAKKDLKELDKALDLGKVGHRKDVYKVK